MNTFAQVDTIYQLCHRRALAYHRVSHDSLRHYGNEVVSLRRAILDAGALETWTGFLGTMQRFRFDVASAPLAFADPYLAPRMSPEEIDAFLRLARMTHPSLAPLGERAWALRRWLSTLTDDPLSEVIRGVVTTTEPSSQIALLVRESRLLVPTRRVIARMDCARQISVMTPNALRRTDLYDLVVVVGDVARLPEYDFVFSAPRASSIVVVGYAWYRGQWHPEPAFTGSIRGQLLPPHIDITEREEYLDALDPDFIPEEFERTIKKAAAVDGGDEIDLTRARLYRLDGGHGVYLEATGRRATMVIDLDAPEEDRVSQVSDEDVETGMFVVLRTDDHGDYIALTADRMMGAKAHRYRAELAEWKNRLRRIVRNFGAEETLHQIRNAGAPTANQSKLQNWLSERNIAPGERADFHATAELTSLAEKSEELWGIAREVRAFHIRAGSAIRNRLVELVRDVDPNELESRGHMEFELPEAEGGRMTAYRVEWAASQPTLVPSAQIERVFRNKD